MDTPTRAEILKTIKTLKNYKAPGDDGLPPELYKQFSEVTTEQLLGILEEVWRTFVPKDWKTSVILPFYKEGDKTERKNYRGISLIDIAVEIFGIILLNYSKGQGRKEVEEIKPVYDQVDAVLIIFSPFASLSSSLKGTT